MMNSVNSFTMNYSNVVNLPFAEKLRATRLAGYSTMSLNSGYSKLRMQAAVS